MRLTFKLRFHTSYGDSLWLTGDHEIFGDRDHEKAIPLHYVDSQFWQVTFVLPRRAVPDAEITYHYVWRQADGGVSEDWGVGRTINPSRHSCEELVIVDSWNHPGFYENAFYTEPFRNVLLRENYTGVATKADSNRASHVFRVKAPVLTKGQTVCLLGNCSALRHWKTNDPVVMSRGSDEDY